MPYVGSLPQSGCTFTDPTQFVMIEFEFGSTAADEMSVFQRLLLVKGINPLRLAPCPVDIPLQARLPPPVPFPLPPVPPAPPLLVLPPDCLETPEQAVRAATMAIMEKRNTIVLTRRIATFCATRRKSERGLSDMSHFQGRAASSMVSRAERSWLHPYCRTDRTRGLQRRVRRKYLSRIRERP